ncbi:MAG: hypothetical protein A2826_01050 [Candidatus Doudnabacteria bacterium RIFCSPHIGHO2_01_FULL_43_23]|uniref:Cell envelope-related transcriptional attenuator domain-containing protein n=1 Tax=Candidatus Doudnabacteria bacterium RIFCSPHIGHO2_01_FULL_43_23 TaxID=1817822 RepID=A0A1F5NRA4_9BACT|nr:MAG: hypothetical protein A2826_01050 [Candidatus Doudnabacteria bacterium RIFCSPHIGHO2_01_FULL_43_23]
MFEEDVQKSSIDSILQKRKGTKPKKTKRPEPEKPKTVIEEAFATDSDSPPAFNLSKKDNSKNKFYKRKKFWWSLATIIVIAGVLWGGFWLFSMGKRIFQGSSPFSFFSSFGSLVTSDDTPLLGEDEGEINILLLGIGGAGHEGGTLADTIILASVHPGQDDKPGEVSLLSVPRDFIVFLPAGYDYRKINSAYAYGELAGEGQGAQWMQDVIEDWTGLSVPYYAVIDFTGFEQVIDDLEGIEINVGNGFSDSSYPDNNYGYLPTITFEKGPQHMDGQRALQFVRSRYGTNGEGSDFARSRRQQQVLSAIKQKATELRISTNLGTVTKLLDTFADNFKTNMTPPELKKLYDLTKEISQENILPFALDYSTGIICNELVEETGAAVITVCPGNTKEDVRRVVADRFNISRTQKESPLIEFQNATKVNFLAQRAADELTSEFTETVTANYPGEDLLETSIIYDLSGGTKPLTLSFLTSKLSVPVLTDYPFIEALSDPKPDFVVVLGQDAAVKFPLK